MLLADTCGAVVAAQSYSRFHFYRRNMCVPFNQHFAVFFTHSAIRLTQNATTFLHPVRARIPLCGHSVRWCYNHSVYTFCDRMVSELVQMVGEYVPQIQGMSFVPPFSFGRGMYRDDGGPNRLFFTYLFCDKALAIRFLTDVKLIGSEVLCEICGRFMRFCAEPIVSEGFRWRCNTRSAGMTCRRSMSIRDGSWFQQSNLTLLEILLLTQHIVCREQAQQIQSEYRFGSHTLANWGMFCREVMLVFLERSSVKIGGPNKTVEIDDSKFGRRKYHRGRPVKGQ